MIYVDGLGYVNQTNQTANTSNTSTSGVSTFDNILAEETANINNSTKTYNLEDIFNEAAQKYNLPVNLLKAIGYNESGFNPDATSHCGAMGIMQLMPATANSLGVTNAYDPYENIMGAAKLLRKLSDMYNGNQTLMIAAYNAGSGNVEKYGGIPPFTETQNYVAKVLKSLETGVTLPGQVTVSTQQPAGSVPDTQTNQPDTALPKDQESFYASSNLDNIFSYSEYELLMTYFENMLEIIASIGDDNPDTSNKEDDSLADLFRLGNSNIRFSRNNINLF